MADHNTLLEKLDNLVARFEEVSTLITDPSVIADQKRYVKLTKEYKELGDLMNARKEYVQCLATLDEAKQILMTETDTEMKEMAREEGVLGKDIFGSGFDFDILPLPSKFILRLNKFWNVFDSRN